ncbi:hypothetical protein [Alienimonas californiensis]|uniref:hypothetical protein n=1 Tax=Alienimonas californiensis TaxID=2527989 RepID=UPI0013FD0C35|nr:hypothetical protein [Alienimonas californiensis]
MNKRPHIDKGDVGTPGGGDPTPSEGNLKCRLDPTIYVAVVSALPNLFGILAILLVLALYQPLISSHFSRVSGVKALGIEITLAAQQLQEAAELQVGVTLTEGQKLTAVKRAEHVAPLFDNARILWVDDTPQNNRPLRTLLRDLGAKTDTALSSTEAIELMRRFDYSVVISDIRRESEGPTGSHAGLSMLGQMRRLDFPHYVIFYVGELHGVELNGVSNRLVPEGAFAITNRPDELLNYVIDALERDTWGSGASSAE